VNPPRRWPKRVLHSIRVRPRLATSMSLGPAAALLLPHSIAAPTRALLAWDLAAGLYLALAFVMMLGGSVERMRWRARLQDDGAATVLALTVAAALASLAGITLELVGVKNYPPRGQVLHLLLAASTILVSWTFIHTAFALHYAHEFYRDHSRACLEFPGGGAPDYLDFLYFSFVIGTTSQTADVSISSRSMRRLALLQGVIAFFFNTTLLALTINIAAGLT